MIRRMMTGGILLSLVILASPPTGAGEVGGPIVFLKQHHFDFKEVLEGEVLSHTFSVLNKGNDPLRILRVRPG
jgi:hypothetical protein